MFFLCGVDMNEAVSARGFSQFLSTVAKVLLIVGAAGFLYHFNIYN